MKNEILLFEHVSLPCLVIEFFTTEVANLSYICHSGPFTLCPAVFLTSCLLCPQRGYRPIKRIKQLKLCKVT